MLWSGLGITLTGLVIVAIAAIVVTHPSLLARALEDQQRFRRLVRLRPVDPRSYDRGLKVGLWVAVGTGMIFAVFGIVTVLQALTQP
jgi:hypothetical protein